MLFPSFSCHFPVIILVVFPGTAGTNTDEFGRDRSKYEETARQRRAAEREGRRNRRRKKRSDVADHHDGMSSDDEELDAEVTKFNTDKGIEDAENCLYWKGLN